MRLRVPRVGFEIAGTTFERSSDGSDYPNVDVTDVARRLESRVLHTRRQVCSRLLADAIGVNR